MIIWKQLAHPHILGFYGAFRDENSRFIPFSLVLPWMKWGNIRQYAAALPRNAETSRLLVTWVLA